MDIKDREERIQLGQQKPRREMVTLCASPSQERVPIHLTALRLDGFLELESSGGPSWDQERNTEYRDIVDLTMELKSKCKAEEIVLG